MKNETKQYVKMQVTKYLHRFHPEFSATRIEKIATYHSVHPLSCGYKNEEHSLKLDTDSVICNYYYMLSFTEVKLDAIEKTIAPNLRESKQYRRIDR